MKKEIVTCMTPEGRELLATPSKRIDHDMDAEHMHRIIRDLVDTADAEKNPRALGLAANQIATCKEDCVRIFVMRWGAHWIPIVNPLIGEESKKRATLYERCLSRPGRPPIKTSRAKSLRLRYLAPTEEGRCELIERKFKSRDAIVIQHEMDHLAGILV